MIRGALSNLGINCIVTAEVSAMPACKFIYNKEYHNKIKKNLIYCLYCSEKNEKQIQDSCISFGTGSMAIVCGKISMFLAILGKNLMGNIYLVVEM